MAQTILAAVAKAPAGGTSVQILSADVYGSGETASTWNVALGMQAAVNNGATLVNLSLGGAGRSSVLESLIQSAETRRHRIFRGGGQ